MSENKTGKYLKYAIGEIVLVVIGILIALQINNLNDERKTENIKQIYYKQLLKDFDTNRTYIEVTTLSINSNLLKYEDYKETFKQPNLPMHQINNNIASLDWKFQVLNFQSNTITTLQNTGDIKLISPIIREQLTRLKKNIEMTENLSIGMREIGLENSNYARRFFGNVTFYKKSIINQPKLLEWINEENRQIQTIVAFQSSIGHKVAAENMYLERFENILSDMDEITTLINDELKK